MEVAPQRRRNIRHLKVGRCNASAVDAHWLTARQVVRAPLECGHAGERSRLLGPIVVVSQGRGAVIAVQCFEDADYAVAVRVWKWPEQHRVHDAEDRRGGADSERERQHDGRRDRWIRAQNTHGEYGVPPEHVNQLGPSHGTLLFSRPCPVPDDRCPPSVHSHRQAPDTWPWTPDSCAG